jgi:hypothetical protein
MLRKGQSIQVAEQAIGPRERTLKARKKITILPSNKAGYVRVTCILGG